MNAVSPLVLPSAMSTNVSSDMMTVTSGLRSCDFAAPFFTAAVVFKSIVQNVSFPAAFLTLNSKMPLFCAFLKGKVQEEEDNTQQCGASKQHLLFLRCLLFLCVFSKDRSQRSQDFRRLGGEKINK